MAKKKQGAPRLLGRVGDPVPARRYLLAVDDFVPPGPIDAKRYFVTSGDAIFKTRALVRDIRARLPEPDSNATLGLLEQLEGAERLLECLVRARGDRVHLELEWDDEHRLWAIPKNPRGVA